MKLTWVHEELRSREQLNICFSQRKCTPGQVGGQNHISDPETALWEASDGVPSGLSAIRKLLSVDQASRASLVTSLPTMMIIGNDL